MDFRSLVGDIPSMEPWGAYTADRAAALSAVPKSTIHYWARSELIIPSVSAERIKLWSYADLLSLRFIYWLRQPKKDDKGREIPRSKMPAVRRALKQLREFDLDLFEHGRPTIWANRAGELYIFPQNASVAETPDGQMADRDMIDLIAPYSLVEGAKGPDLVAPSEFVRIAPRKLAGSPHVVDTRVETLALHALELRGFTSERIGRLYPTLNPAAIDDALTVERQLDANILSLAA